MIFRRQQELARTQSTRLFAGFAVLVLGLAVAVNVGMALLWRLLAGDGAGYPRLFFETNTLVVLGLVIGGAWVELGRLRSGGGQRVAHWMNAHELIDPQDPLERRLLNVASEMSLASGLPMPAVYVMRREDAINAFVAGWNPQDTVLCVTQGALQRLTRDELQGLVAHEYGHLKEDDLQLVMRTIAMVWGLSLVHGYGRQIMGGGLERGGQPARWVLGLVLTCMGWLGWLAGRVLQAAISRQREYLADASAVQFTRTRTSFANVLRKIWHDQEILAGRMHHPQAEMLASALLHDANASQWLSSHPPLPRRIARLCGTVLPPLPAPLLREVVNEPPLAPRPRGTTGHLPMAVLHAQSGQPAASSASADPWTAHMNALGAPAATLATSATLAATPPPADDRDQLARLRRLSGPREKRLAVLSLMMSEGNAAEQRVWARHAEGVALATQISKDVSGLRPIHRLPEFERLSTELRQLPLTERRPLVEAARDLLRADGRVSAKDRLWLLALRYYLGERPSNPAALRRPAAHAQTLSDMTPHERSSVVALTAYLARFVPQPEGPDGLHPAARAWFRSVLTRYSGPSQGLSACPSPDADQLMLALTSVQEMSWMLKPVLVRAWVEEALNHSLDGVLSDHTANALRLMADLLDSPLPPVLREHYQGQ